MQIIIQGHSVDTRNIWDITYTSNSRDVMIEIKIIDKASIKIGCGIPYDSSSYTVESIKAPYKALYESLRTKWKSDFTDLEIFKL